MTAGIIAIQYRHHILLEYKYYTVINNRYSLSRHLWKKQPLPALNENTVRVYLLPDPGTKLCSMSVCVLLGWGRSAFITLALQLCFEEDLQCRIKQTRERNKREKMRRRGNPRQTSLDCLTIMVTSKNIIFA